MDVWHGGRDAALPGPEVSPFDRHPRLALAGILFVSFLILAIVAETALRFLVNYRIDYYTYVTTSNSTHRYPYGEMHINSFGFPDVEWNLSDKRPRIGVIGDSVTAGVGAGAGYRYTDLLGQRFTDRVFFNFAGVGSDGVSGDEVVDKILTLVHRFGLKKIVYGMNLNDILPTSSEGQDALQDGPVIKVLDRVRADLDWLRGRSYLYNTLRTQAKLALVRLGYEAHGMEAFELQPAKNERAIRDTAMRINEMARALREQGVGFCTIIFPYEMQISSEASQTYRAQGISWDPAFDRGLTQRKLLSYLDGSFKTVNGLNAFRETANRSARVGEYFVYNLGDKLDWNHPNRAGHRVIANYLASQAPDCVTP
ncbi:MAG TPA: SGNH/GDSL hydrolase family protein [Candidatus Binatia bacterium]|jgi:lysophospholipase L1-like esterase